MRVQIASHAYVHAWGDALIFRLSGGKSVALSSLLLQLQLLDLRSPESCSPKK